MTRLCLTQLEILSDDVLTERLRDAARREFGATAQLVAHLAEFDARRLHLRAGCASLYVYCTTELHLSEHAAYGRIAAARSGRRWPLILDYLADGRVTLTAVVLLGPHLSGPNHRELLDAVAHRPRRWIEEWLAERRPTPPADDRIRRLPGRGAAAAPSPELEASPELHLDGGGLSLGAPTGRDPGAAADVTPDRLGGACRPRETRGEAEAGTPPAPPLPGPEGHTSAAQRPHDDRASDPGAAGGDDEAVAARARHERISPLDRAVYKVQFTARADTYRRLMQVRELLRHTVPDGDLGTIFDRALRLLHLELARRKYAFVQGTARPSAAAAVVAGESTAGKDPVAAAAGESTGPKASAISAAGGPTGRKVSATEAAGAPTGRQIPAAVRRAVWRRDGGRCRYTGATGRRCDSRGGLEFHHRLAFARGGPATIENIELRCRAHNLYEDEDLARRRDDTERGAARR